MSSLFSTLRIPYGPYPEKIEKYHSSLDQCINRILFNRFRSNRVTKHFKLLLHQINDYGVLLESLNDAELQQSIKTYRQQRRLKGLDKKGVAEGFALVRELSQRTLGLRHHDCQMQGGWVMLNGMVAEMETGEGKTITAALPAAVMAMSGFPVHIITVNDYLAQRDADILRPLYQALGLSVGVVTSSTEVDNKKQAYDCNITYCTNKTLVFDYLRDRMALKNNNNYLRLAIAKFAHTQEQNQPLLLRGLYFAILDEIDSILIDEARTPLVISGEGGRFQEEFFYRQAYDIAMQLNQPADYQILCEEIRITDNGEKKLSQLAEKLGGVWLGKRRRKEAVILALRAINLLRRDEHYIIEDNKVVIIDEYTGRSMPDRFWGHGLQQLVEIKENCTVTGNRETLARISYQRFFRRYHLLAGMSGTAKEVSDELHDVYGLQVLTIPTHKPSQRQIEKTVICANQMQKWQRVTQKVKQLHQQGRPVLIGTRTIDASEQLSQLLTQHGVTHQLLNARQNNEEAEVIAVAGCYGRITIATNMAGRGTDIALDQAAKDVGGLHVILTEAHSSSRIDRQLYGRCARQGNPGSIQAIMAVDDEVVKDIGGLLVKFLQRNPAFLRNNFGQWLARITILMAQKRLERMHFKMRCKMLEQDKQSEETLAFSGYSE